MGISLWKKSKAKHEAGRDKRDFYLTGIKADRFTPRARRVGDAGRRAASRRVASQRRRDSRENTGTEKRKEEEEEEKEEGQRTAERRREIDISRVAHGKTFWLSVGRETISPRIDFLSTSPLRLVVVGGRKLSLSRTRSHDERAYSSGSERASERALRRYRFLTAAAKRTHRVQATYVALRTSVRVVGRVPLGAPEQSVSLLLTLSLSLSV